MAMKFPRLKSTVTSLVALSVFLPVVGCDLANNHLKIDRSGNKEVQDYRDALAPREVGYADQNSDTSGIPDLQSYVADDVEKLPPMPLVSVSINQSIPLREALFELAKQADFDIELDPRIQGSVIFTARNKPFDVVIDRLCQISGLRYKFDGDTMRVELDTPYSKNYKIDYISFVRKNSSTMKTDVSVASSGDSGGVGGGSIFSVDSSSESDFWAELDTNLKQILESGTRGSYLKTSQDPQVTLSAVSPAQPPVPPIDAAAVAPQAGDDMGSYISAPMGLPADSTAADSASVSAPAPDVNVDTSATPAVPASGGAVQPSPVGLGDDQDAQKNTQSGPQTLRIESLPSSSSAGTPNAVDFTPSYSINKQAGIVSVFANERLQKQIQEYLSDLRRSTTAQVLIEAKVLEVSLTDEFSTGIDWNVLGAGDLSLSGTFTKPSLNPSSTNVFAISSDGDNLSTFVRALSRFGTVHALASPRLTVLNNQSAVLNVAKNQVYFELQVQSDSTSDGTNQTTNTTIDTNIKTVPEGVLINVLPSINLDKHSISMQLRPTVTKIAGFVPDPGVAYIAQQNNIDVESNIPIVNIQEVDSVLNVKSGQMMVMGGLLEDNTTSQQGGVPVASEVPVFGGLFRNQGDKVEKKELVIFLKATILDDAGNSIDQTDRDLYRIFSQDRRPSKL